MLYSITKRGKNSKEGLNPAGMATGNTILENNTHRVMPDHKLLFLLYSLVNPFEEQKYLDSIIKVASDCHKQMKWKHLCKYLSERYES